MALNTSMAKCARNDQRNHSGKEEQTKGPKAADQRGTGLPRPRSEGPAEKFPGETAPHAKKKRLGGATGTRGRPAPQSKLKTTLIGAKKRESHRKGHVFGVTQICFTRRRGTQTFPKKGGEGNGQKGQKKN